MRYKLIKSQLAMRATALPLHRPNKKPCNDINKWGRDNRPTQWRSKRFAFLNHGVFASEIFRRLDSSFDLRHAIDAIIKATGGDFYVFGGTIRKAILNENHCGDLDIIVENGNDKIYEAFHDLGLVYTLNSKGHHRYQWNKLQIDICQPKEFFSGYDTVIEMLMNVDLKINSVAFYFKNKSILDPHAFLKTNYNNPGINWSYWKSVNSLHFTVASIRLARLLFDSPTLRLNVQDANEVRSFVIPRLSYCDWNLVRSRFPEGREMFVKLLLKLIQDHDDNLF